MGTKKSLSEQIVPKSVRDEIDRVIAPHLRVRASKGGVCSNKTAYERRLTIHATFAQLWVLGYKLRKLESLSVKHIRALTTLWEHENKSPAFLHNRLSLLRTLCGWLGKRHVVGDLSDYFPKERTRRVTATDKSLSWEDNGVDADAIIELAKTVDERLAVMLALQHHFGLRTKEAIEFRPLNALVDGGTHLQIYEGTKGGKPRIVPIRTDKERAVYEWSRRVVMGGQSKRLRWPGLTEAQARNRYYHLMERKLKISKAWRGVTGHGLRHGWAHRNYRVESGFRSPVEQLAAKFYSGGSVQGPVLMPIPDSVLAVKTVKQKPVPPPGLTREAHQQACMATSMALGHGRIDVTPAYYGTYGHGFRTVSPTTTMETQKAI